jgi:hypothetical protein
MTRYDIERAVSWWPTVVWQTAQCHLSQSIAHKSDYKHLDRPAWQITHYNEAHVHRYTCGFLFHLTFWRAMEIQQTVPSTAARSKHRYWIHWHKRHSDTHISRCTSGQMLFTWSMWHVERFCLYMKDMPTDAVFRDCQTVRRLKLMVAFYWVHIYLIIYRHVRKCKHSATIANELLLFCHRLWRSEKCFSMSFTFSLYIFHPYMVFNAGHCTIWQLSAATSCRLACPINAFDHRRYEVVAESNDCCICCITNIEKNTQSQSTRYQISDMYLQSLAIKINLSYAPSLQTDTILIISPYIRSPYHILWFVMSWGQTLSPVHIVTHFTSYILQMKLTH